MQAFHSRFCSPKAAKACVRGCGHTQCMHNMYLLGNLGHAPTMKIFTIIHSIIASEAVFSHGYHSFSLTCMLTSHLHETCDHTWSLHGLSFHNILPRAPANFTWAQARICLGVATPLGVAMPLPPMTFWGASMSQIAAMIVYMCIIIYTIVSQKRAQYQISAHPPLLLQFPAKV